MTILDSSEPSTAGPDHGASYRSPAQTALLELSAQLHKGYAVVSVRGELNAVTIDDLTRLADALAREGRPRIVLGSV